MASDKKTRKASSTRRYVILPLRGLKDVSMTVLPREAESTHHLPARPALQPSRAGAAVRPPTYTVVRSMRTIIRREGPRSEDASRAVPQSQSLSSLAGPPSLRRPSSVGVGFRARSPGCGQPPPEFLTYLAPVLGAAVTTMEGAGVETRLASSPRRWSSSCVAVAGARSARCSPTSLRRPAARASGSRSQIAREPRISILEWRGAVGSATKVEFRRRAGGPRDCAG
jgi:hypothetical protein